ncbi:zinc finger BED domain-containing protein RICESLEEPER 2-like [Ziziphus jujuba]|uniref:Zinc finger BED domain-containing protein RICESLEEPER 2-like n=1 Tax=Ziziphus jujuba TaxID=326968 RepID=A0ABM4A7W2_ZIZJJ|nr:zinc finger BED domain-containing protein RICESLEEPER 2-like [Ziziphus jujuba]
MDSGNDIETHSTSSESAASASLLPLPPSSLGKRKPSRKPSMVWDHYEKIENSDPDNPRCKYKYCGVDYACNSKYGTNTLLNHLNHHCKKYIYRVQDKKQKILTFGAQNESDGSNLFAVGFNKEACRLACAKMIILDKLPFSFVEGHGFRMFFNVACPKFDPPSRRTIVKDIYALYLDEKLQLKNTFSLNCQRISLTTDTWTSIQNINYMSLTAHYIDSNWMLHKRILNFCVIPNHKGETIGKPIGNCLYEWGIERVFTITVDNASTNNVAIEYIKRKLNNWKGCVLDGLREAHDSIASIRNAVRYVRSSPARLQKFKEYAAQEKIESNSLVFLDVPTRWNSTYLMLEAALKFQNAFEILEEYDGHYLSYFREDDGGRKRLGPPNFVDWNNALIFVKFLKSFYDVTLKFSSSLHVISNAYFHEICSIQSQLDAWSLSGDYLLSDIANKMMRKFDNYWGKMDDINPLLLIAAVLHPRYKLDYVEYCFGDIYAEDVAGLIAKNLKEILMSLYDWYKASEVILDGNQSSKDKELESCVTNKKNSEVDINLLRISKFKRKKAAKESIEIKNDVDRYLLDPCEDISKKDFDVLNWWRVNGNKYPILSKLAKDMFAIQVSTVASESAFSTGGRILDPFRSSLTPKMVEVLVCTQNWLKASSVGRCGIL